MKLYLKETMPDHLRSSHRAAGNWGSHPHNGAVRAWSPDPDLYDDGEYDSIVREAEVPFSDSARIKTVGLSEEDSDTGRIYCYIDPETVRVGWDSGIVTECAVSQLELE